MTRPKTTATTAGQRSARLPAIPAEDEQGEGVPDPKGVNEAPRPLDLAGTGGAAREDAAKSDTEQHEKREETAKEPCLGGGTEEIEEGGEKAERQSVDQRLGGGVEKGDGAFGGAQHDRGGQRQDGRHGAGDRAEPGITPRAGTVSA
jgi:hypothetical protein